MMVEMTNEDLKEFYKLVFPEHSLEDIGNFLNTKLDQLGVDEFTAENNRIGSQIEIVKRILDANSNQTELAKKYLDGIDPKNCGSEYAHESSEEDDGFVIKNKVLTLDKTLHGTEVNGKQARMLILAHNKNVKRVNLFNSGFYITLRGPSLSEINIIYNRLSDKINSYGKTFGAIFYLHSDISIKEIIWDFIESLVIDSNLTKWDNTNRLRNNVSLLDYHLIIINIGTLMYKNGYNFVHTCTNVDCDYTETEKIDLGGLQLTDFNKIPLDKLRFIAKAPKVEIDDATDYRKAINNSTEFVIDKFKIYCKVPSIGAHIRSGNQFNQEMLSTIYNAKDEDEINQYLKYNFNRIFNAWIYKIEVMDAEGNVSFRINDNESIALALNELQSTSESSLVDKMNEFIKEATVTHIGYVTKKCPKCGKLPSNAIEETGLVTIDPQNAFFTILVMRLIQNS